MHLKGNRKLEFETTQLSMQSIECTVHLSPFWHATINSVSLGNFSSTLAKNWLLKKADK